MTGQLVICVPLKNISTSLNKVSDYLKMAPHGMLGAALSISEHLQLHSSQTTQVVVPDRSFD